MANDWHFVHLGSRAVGGAGLVVAEATAVTPKGRISPWDLGLWNDEQIEPLRRITAFIREQGAVPGVQLAHAGRKGSTRRPWEGGGAVPLSEGGWIPVAPSAIPFAPNYPSPEALTVKGIGEVVEAFAASARRALEAGFRLIEIHAAHGYLIHQFLSPLSNQRDDAYGGTLENRSRFLVEIVQAVRAVWPQELPLSVRLSATDWIPDGWDIEECVEVSRCIAPMGVDLIDCSSGGTVPHPPIPIGPNYQVPFAARIREAGVPTMAVGLIIGPAQADAIVRTGQADLVALARAELRDPYWPLHAAKTLGHSIPWPKQYERARD